MHHQYIYNCYMFQLIEWIEVFLKKLVT